VQADSPLAVTGVSPVVDAPLVERLFFPVYRFARISGSSGIVLLAAAVAALLWANSPWTHSYHALWETALAVRLGPYALDTTLHHLINDGLMAVFFFLVGLEIKREVIAGELSTLRSAALPMIAALGGMVVPALIYALVNHAGPATRGWGIPMATDIAFAIGVLALLGDKVPNGLKVFLAALAIVDDIGAVLVIAVFYSSGLQWSALGLAAGVFGVAVLANRAGVRSSWAYGAIGIALWATFALSGIHATVAGVLLAMAIPVRTRIAETHFLGAARSAIEQFDGAAQVTARDPDTSVLSNTQHHEALDELERLTERAQPPLIRFERALHGIVAFGIMPLFAFANAGVTIFGTGAGIPFTAVSLGVLLALVIGKPAGIMAFSWAAVRLRMATLPKAVDWSLILGAGMLGGIGFTMALFIAGLAFPVAEFLEFAKVGIFAASALSGIAGWLFLRRALLARTRRAAADAAAGSP